MTWKQIQCLDINTPLFFHHFVSSSSAHLIRIEGTHPDIRMEPRLVLREIHQLNHACLNIHPPLRHNSPAPIKDMSGASSPSFPTVALILSLFQVALSR